jgi:hypothetical protein
VKIFWTSHAQKRFLERALIYGFNRGELDYLVLHQQVRIKKGFDKKYKTDKFETIGLVGKIYLTVQKAEDLQKIIVITLWESNKKEVNLWFSKQK